MLQHHNHYGLADRFVLKIIYPILDHEIQKLLKKASLVLKTNQSFLV